MRPGDGDWPPRICALCDKCRGRVGREWLVLVELGLLQRVGEPKSWERSRSGVDDWKANFHSFPLVAVLVPIIAWW